jgi:Rieske Fe-S protein
LSNCEQPGANGGCTNCGQCGKGSLEGVEKWREDFPVEWAQDNYITRRDFARFLIFTSGATVLGNGYFVLKNAIQRAQPAAEPVRVAALDEVPVGGVKLFRFPSEHDPAILVHLEQDRYVAFRQRCTHLSGPVIFLPKTGELYCPCHHGVFDAATGRVLAGPPPRPLPQIALAVRDGAIWADGLAESNPADNSTGRSTATGETAPAGPKVHEKERQG